MLPCFIYATSSTLVFGNLPGSVSILFFNSITLLWMDKMDAYAYINIDISMQLERNTVDQMEKSGED